MVEQGQAAEVAPGTQVLKGPLPHFSRIIFLEAAVLNHDKLLFGFQYKIYGRAKQSAAVQIADGVLAVDMASLELLCQECAPGIAPLDEFLRVCLAQFIALDEPLGHLQAFSWLVCLAVGNEEGFCRLSCGVEVSALGQRQGAAISG